MELSRISTRIFMLMLLAQPAMLYGMAMQNIQFVRMPSYVFLLGGLYLMLINWSKSKSEKSLFCGLVVVVLLSLFFSDLTYESFIASLGFVIMLGTWMSHGNIRIDRNIGLVKISILTQALLLVYLKSSPFAHSQPFQDGYLEVPELTLGFPNPNLTGMLLFFVISLMLWLYESEANKMYRLFYLIIGLFLLEELIETGSRTCLIGVVSILILQTATQYNSHIKSLLLSKYSILAVVLFPLIFSVFYMYMFLNSSGSVESIEFLGKPLFSGRELLFKSAMESLESNPIIGNAGVFGFSNFHNSMLTVIVNIGILGAILYTLYQYKNLVALSNDIRYRDSSSLKIFVSLLFIYIASSSEASFLISGSIYYSYLLTYMVLCKSSNNEK